MEPESEYNLPVPTGIMTIKEAAEYMSLSEIRVRELVRAGRLPAKKIGNTYILAEKAVHYFAQIDRPVGRPPIEKEAGDE